MEEHEIIELKSNLQDYLERNGIQTDRFFRCINPNHLDRNPSMKYFEDNKVHCFGCGITYDLFGAIAAIENLDSKEAFKKAIDYYGKGYDVVKKHSEKKLEDVDEKVVKDYSKAFDFWHNNLMSNNKAMDYLSSRGISGQTAKRFNLGYNEFKFGKICFNSIVIPVNDNCFTARNIDKTSEFRHYKPKNVHTEILNIEALINDYPYCVITEGEFDCLSYEEIGVNSISLGSVSNINKFIVADKAPKTFILALDNDEAGEIATKELEDYFRIHKIPYETYDNCGYKDGNEALVKDRKNFERGIERIIERINRRVSKRNEEMT